MVVMTSSNPTNVLARLREDALPRQRVSTCSVCECGRNAHARCDPGVVGFELQTEPVVEDPQVSVPPASNRVRPDRLHLLRHHADIDLVATVVGEAIEADALVE